MDQLSFYNANCGERSRDFSNARERQMNGTYISGDDHLENCEENAQDKDLRGVTSRDI